jgi:tellurite resistance protein
MDSADEYSRSNNGGAPGTLPLKSRHGMHPIEPQDALIYMMVMVSAVDREMHDVEIRHIGRLLRELPVFAGFDETRLMAVVKAASGLMARPDGLKRTLTLLGMSVPRRLRETAYVLACEIAAADRKLPMDELRTLQLLRQALGLDRLLATASERCTAARFAKV